MKNRIKNPSFNLLAAGMPNSTFATATAVETARNWWIKQDPDSGTAISATVSQQSFTLGAALIPGEPHKYLRVALADAGTSLGANSYFKLYTQLRDIQVFNGRYAVLSFYAKSDIGSREIAVSVRRTYGTGGSPSADNVLVAQSLYLSTSWTRYEILVPVTPMTGTLGSNGDSAFQVDFFLQAASGQIPGITGDGVNAPGANTIEIAHPQFEAGFSASEFEDEVVRGYQKGAAGGVAPLDPSTGAVPPEYRTPWSLISANTTAVSRQNYLVNTASAGVTVTLPATPAVGDFVELQDATGTWNTNNVTVNPNSLKIKNSTSNVTLSTANAKVRFVYVSAAYGWAQA